MKELLFKNIETYSNSVVGFIVLQGLAYSFYLGSNESFNCRIKGSEWLAELLTIQFFVITILAAVAIRYLGKKLVEIAPDSRDTLKAISEGKIVAVCIFGLFPAFLTFFYGVLTEAPKACEKFLL